MAAPRTAAARDADKPTIHASAKKLDVEAKPDAFVYMTKGNKRIVFPDPFEMEWEEAEEFLTKMDTLGSSREALVEWLTEEEFGWLKADKLTLREMLGLVQMIQAHYGSFMGNQGEGQASAS